MSEPQGQGEACDAISFGVGFTAGQATPGKAVHVDDPVACASRPDAGTDAATDAGSDAAK